MNGSAMTETPIDREFSAELARIRLGEDVVPFLDQILTVSEVEFRPLPDEMRAIIQSSNDFVSIVPGSPSTWLHIEGDGANIALVIYRAGDGSYRVLGPVPAD